MGSILDKYTRQTQGYGLTKKYTVEQNNSNTLDSLGRENNNYTNRINSIVGQTGVTPNNESPSNPLMKALQFLSRFSYAANNLMMEKADPNYGATPGKFDPIDAYVRGWRLQETPLMKDFFVKSGISDESLWKGNIGPINIDINPAGTLGLATELLNPIDPLNWLGGFGVTKGAIKGAKGAEALTKAFGEDAARKIVSHLGEDAISELGAKTVGELSGRVKDLALEMGQSGKIATPVIDDVINSLKQGVIDTGNLATTKLPYKVSKQLTQRIAPPFGKTVKEFAIPGTAPLVDAAGALGRGVGKVTGKAGEWLAKNFNTKYIPKEVPNRLTMKNLNAIKTLEQMITDLERNPSPQTSMTLDTLKSLQEELKGYKLPALDQTDMPRWLADTRDWLNGDNNPINELLKPYRQRANVTDTLGTVGEDTSKRLAPTFYNKSQEIIEQKMSNVMPVDQFIKFLNSNQVKAEEMNWLDIEGLVEGKTKITKQEALDWIKNHDLWLEEVTKDNRLIVPPEVRNTEWYQKLSQTYGEKDAYDIIKQYHDDGMSEEKLLDLLKPAGMGQREADQILTAPVGNDIGSMTKYNSYKEPGGKDYTEMLITMPKAKGTYSSGHWDEKNILAHVRFDTREVDGKKILFVQEVQSDWHQAGRKEGYAKAIPKEAQPLVDRYKELENKIVDSDNDNLVLLAQGKHPLEKEMDSILEELKTKYDVNLSQVMGIDGVPDAPFKKTWPELVMKRMIRYASENGYDGISWTTGKQQAERYGLSKMVDRLKYSEGRLVGNRGDIRIIDKEVSPEQLSDYVGEDLAKELMYNEGVMIPASTEIGGRGMRKFYDEMLPSTVDKYVKKWGSKTEQKEIPMGIKTEMMDNLNEYTDGIYDVVSEYPEHALQDPDIMREAVLDWVEALKNNEGINPGFSFWSAETIANKWTDNILESLDDAESFASYDMKDLKDGIIKDLMKNYPNKDTSFMSMQHHLPITDAMRNEVLTKGQPLFRGAEYNSISAPDLLSKAMMDPNKRVFNMVEALTQVFGMQKYEAITVAEQMEKIFEEANKGMTQGFNLHKQLGQMLGESGTAIADDIINNGEKWFQSDWRELLPVVEQLTGLQGEEAFRATMKVKTVLDRLYDNIPEQFKPYFTGIFDQNPEIGMKSGLDTTLNGNNGYVYNYKGAPIFHPINSGLNYNMSASDPEVIQNIMNAIDGLSGNAEMSPQLVQRYMMDPTGLSWGDAAGLSSNQKGNLWFNPSEGYNTYDLGDTLNHETMHQVQRAALDGNNANIYDKPEMVKEYFHNTVQEDLKYINENGIENLQKAIDESNISAVDKEKFRESLETITDDIHHGLVSPYSRLTQVVAGDEQAWLESVAEDSMLYMRNPELYQKIFPNRSQVLDSLFETATKDLIPVTEVMKKVQTGSSKVAQQFEAGTKFIDEEITRIMNELDKNTKELENLRFQDLGGKRAYKEIKKGLVDIFERASSKETDFLKQVETIFKGTSKNDRKEIMEYLSRGEEDLLPEHLQPMANAFVRWRESVIKEYHELGIPVKALENYVPFIPLRSLKHEESSMLNTLYNTGERQLEDANDWLFDLDPNIQHRTTQAISPADVNSVLGKEWLTEDAALAMAIRGTRAIRAQESVPFMKGVIEKYGLTLEDIAANQKGLPKGYKFYSSSIEGTGKPILREMQNIDAESGVFALPEEFAKVFNEYTNLLHDPQASNAFLRMYDKVTSAYKKVAYLWNPGHIPRDAISNMFNGWLMGNNSPKSYIKSANFIANYLTGNGDKMIRVGRKTLTVDEFWKVAQDYGILDVGASLAETPVQVPKVIGRRMPNYTSMMRTASRTNDAWTRVANFMYLIDNGMHPEQAAVQVKKFLFDYFDLTSFEKKVMRRIIPFYSWMRKNIPLQVEQLFTNMAKYGRVEKVLRNVQGEPWDPEHNPDFINESGAIKLPGKDGERIYAAPNLPYTDLARVPMDMNSFGNLLAGINPLIRAPFIELPTNTQLFSGRPIEQFTGEQQDLPFAAIIKQLTGGDMPQVDKRGLGYLMNQIPILRNLDAISNPDNPRQMPKISSFIGGPNYYTEDQVKKAQAYQERDRLRDTIRSIQAQGVDVPTTRELEKQQEKSNTRRSLVDKYKGGK